MPACWVCLEEGPDDAGQPLQGELCACRGSASHAHIRCVVQYARSANSGPNAVEAWQVCPTCKQDYASDGLRMALAREHHSMVHGEGEGGQPERLFVARQLTVHTITVYCHSHQSYAAAILNHTCAICIGSAVHWAASSG